MDRYSSQLSSVILLSINFQAYLQYQPSWYFFRFSNIPETSWMIDSNTENTKLKKSSQVVTRGLSLTVIIQSIKPTQRTFRLGRISRDNKHKTRNTGSAQLTLRWCSNAGIWAVVLLMRGNGWLARWSWWLISFLEPYHKGSQRYESDPCICDVQIWGLLKKTLTKCWNNFHWLLLLFMIDYSTYREPSINPQA